MQASATCHSQAAN